MIVATDRKLLEEGDPAFDPRTFRHCLGQFATGVAVVTAQADGQRVGVTVNSFSSVSLDPPLVLWSIKRQSRSLPVFQSASHFAVHILSADQINESRHFSGSEADKFIDRSFRQGRGGAPLLDGVVACFECRREVIHEGGDHVILVGHVEHFARFNGEPLLFVQGRYGVAADHPDLSLEQKVIGSSTEPAYSTYGRSVYERSILSRLFRAQYYLSAIFDEHRKAEGLNLSLIRVLICAYESPGVTLEDLVRTTYLGERDAEDASADLIARSYLIRDMNGGLVPTPDGRRLREAMGKRWEEFEAQQMEGLSKADISSFERVLTKLVERNAPQP